jgi:hypothetical protein
MYGHFMAATGTVVVALSIAPPLHTATINCTIDIDLAKITHQVPEAMNGCHFSPLDHQLFYVYSQMVYDESFEQSISDKPDTKELGNEISLGWSNTTNTLCGDAQWINDSAYAFNGNVSVRLTLNDTADNETNTGQNRSRVGVAARGLYHQGFQLHAHKDYIGYLAIRAKVWSTVHVRLEDWESNPRLGNEIQSSDSEPIELAHAALVHPGGDEWIVFNFTLVPSASTACLPFPFGQAPLYCSIPNSQQKLPPSATDSCVVCGGTLTITVQVVVVVQLS